MLLLGTAELWGAPHPHKNVLVLVSDEPNLPAISAAMDGMKRQFLKDDPGAVSLFTEYLDLNRFEGADYVSGILRWEQRKYQGIKLDLILCASMPVLRLMLVERDRLWPGVPMAFLGVDDDDLAGTKLPPDMTGCLMKTDFEGTARLALKLLPATKHFAIVSGSSLRDRIANKQMMADVAKLQSSVDVIDLGDLPFDELQVRLSSLPSDTVVLGVTVTQDRNGRRFVPKDAMAVLTPKSNAPVFSAIGTYMGTGIVGGNVVDYQVVGRDAAILGQQILYEGLKGGAMPISGSGNRIKLDWRQLRKWSIPEDRIPGGAAVLFKSPTLWDVYRTWILVALGFLIVQSIFIGLLIAKGRNLAAARRELVHLSSKLITAQDEERARLARELHDDLSQRLALFSIEIDQIREDVRDDAAGKALQDLSAKAEAAAADVHGMAHGLHPSKLDHLGLLPAVKEFCREVELRNALDVTITNDNWPAHLDKNVTLCLYRIVQESVQNVVRHSQAERALLEFMGRDNALRLNITDNGRGFDTSAVAEGFGLGLAGMRERLRGVRGRIKVHSKPGAGTRIEVIVPAVAAMSAELSESAV